MRRVVSIVSLFLICLTLLSCGPKPFMDCRVDAYYTDGEIKYSEIDTALKKHLKKRFSSIDLEKEENLNFDKEYILHLKYRIVLDLILKKTNAGNKNIDEIKKYLEENEVRIVRDKEKVISVENILQLRRDKLSGIVSEIRTNYKAYDDLKEICDKLPHRLSGTENGKAAEEFFYNKMKSYGLDVKYLPFEMNVWKRKSAKLVIENEEGSVEFKTFSFAYTPVKSDIKANLIDLGDGLPDDLEKAGDSIKGKVALINIKIHNKHEAKVYGNPHRSIKVANAMEAGASAVILVNQNNNIMTGTVAKIDKLIGIPAVCVSYGDSVKIREMLEKSECKAKINVRNEFYKTTVRSIIATIPGMENPEEKVVIGGHLDSWDLSDGAIDNGIGVFAILDMARAFQKSGFIPRRTIEFIGWVGEEEGLLGSKAYIREAHKQGKLDNIKMYLNIDMHGNPRGFDVEGRKDFIPFAEGLTSLIKGLGIDYEGKVINYPTTGPYYDVVSFGVQGIPILHEYSQLNPKIYRYYHTEYDDFKLVNKDHMIKSSAVMGIMLYELSTVYDFPVERYNKEETERFYKQYGGEVLLDPIYLWNLRE